MTTEHDIMWLWAISGANLIFSIIILTLVFAINEKQAHTDNHILTTINVNGIERLPQNTLILCEQGVSITQYTCNGCSTWLEGKGKCAYLKEAGR